VPKIKVKDIKVKKRRPLSNAAVVEMIKSMEILGQLQPIIISSDGFLIAGGHRLEAAKHLGWKHIEAKKLDGNVIVPKMAFMHILLGQRSPLIFHCINRSTCSFTSAAA